MLKWKWFYKKISGFFYIKKCEIASVASRCYHGRAQLIVNFHGYVYYAESRRYLWAPAKITRRRGGEEEEGGGRVPSRSHNRTTLDFRCAAVEFAGSSRNPEARAKAEATAQRRSSSQSIDRQACNKSLYCYTFSPSYLSSFLLHCFHYF